MHLIWLQTRLPPATVAGDVDNLPLGVKLHEAPVSQVYLSYLLQVDAIDLRHWAEFTRTTRPNKNKVDYKRERQRKSCRALLFLLKVLLFVGGFSRNVH